MQTATKPDTLVIAGTELRSRVFVGTGKYSDDATMVAALEASGCELVTVALRRRESSPARCYPLPEHPVRPLRCCSPGSATRS